MKFKYCDINESRKILKDYPYKIGKFELPTRSTSGSAGYDFRCPFELTIHSRESVKIPLLVAVEDMPNDAVLFIYNRSSLALKGHLTLDNAVAVIDSDYKLCIWLQITNNSDINYTLNVNDKIAQGIFVKYMTVDDDNSSFERVGGIGSTGK